MGERGREREGERERREREIEGGRNYNTTLCAVAKATLSKLLLWLLCDQLSELLLYAHKLRKYAKVDLKHPTIHTGTQWTICVAAFKGRC